MNVEPFRTCAWNNSAHTCIGNGREEEWKGRGDVQSPSHSQLVATTVRRTLRTARPANGMGASR